MKTKVKQHGTWLTVRQVTIWEHYTAIGLHDVDVVAKYPRLASLAMTPWLKYFFSEPLDDIC